MRDTFTRCLEAYAETHPELVLVTGDLGFGVLFPYICLLYTSDAADE